MSPEKVEICEDGNTHYFRRIEEFENRFLHVVVNEEINPKRVVTLFFDRRVKEV